MDARTIRCAAAALLLAVVLPTASFAAQARSTNFIVTAPSAELARTAADLAEQFRRDLALEWVGYELPRWTQPCPITLRVGSHLGAGGATSFMFDRGRPYAWKMNIQGSRERILDSVLPHEVLHTIFATHFGRPLPRWADEGAATSVEHDEEKKKYDRMLYQFLTTGRGIPFAQMFRMMEYPSDMLPLYAQGNSVVRYLLAHGSKRDYVQFVERGLKSGDWPSSLQKSYGFRDLSDLQVSWNQWVADGCPAVVPENGRGDVMVAGLDRGSQAVGSYGASPRTAGQHRGAGDLGARGAGVQAAGFEQPVQSAVSQPLYPGQRVVPAGAVWQGDYSQSRSGRSIPGSRHVGQAKGMIPVPPITAGEMLTPQQLAALQSAGQVVAVEPHGLADASKWYSRRRREYAKARHAGGAALRRTVPADARNGQQSTLADRLRRIRPENRPASDPTPHSDPFAARSRESDPQVVLEWGEPAATAPTDRGPLYDASAGGRMIR